MRVLAIDTATAACSVALWAGTGTDGTVVARRFQALARGQAEVLMPMIDAVLNDAHIGFGDVDLFGVTVGPGAFTGLRIGLAAARGLALATGRPLLGVTTFEAIAHAVPADRRHGRSLLVAIESKREDVFAQLFDAGLTPVGDAVAAPPASVVAIAAARLPTGPLLIAGDAARRVAEVAGVAGAPGSGEPAVAVADGPGLPDAATVARLVARDAASGASRARTGTFPLPFYLRPPDARLPDKG